MIEQTMIPTLNSMFRFQYEQAQNCHVLLFPEGMVKLNDSASEIIQLIDGNSSVQQIVKSLAAKFPDAGDFFRCELLVAVNGGQQNRRIVERHRIRNGTDGKIVIRIIKPANDPGAGRQMPAGGAARGDDAIGINAEPLTVFANPADGGVGVL